MPASEKRDEDGDYAIRRAGIDLEPIPLPPLCPPRVATVTSMSTAHEYPEGGARAILTVCGAFVALFCTFGQMNAFGTFQTWYAAHQLEHLAPSTISWIGSLQLCIFFLSGGPIGWAFDAYGPAPILVAGTMVFVTSIVLTSLSTLYYEYILCQGILFGLGVGLLFYPSMASTSTYFCQYRATALGIVAAGSSIGGVVYPIMLQNLFQTIGFAWGVRVSALVSGACCVVATLTITTRLPPVKSCVPRLVGLAAVKDTKFVLLAAGCTFVAFGLFIPFFYIVDYTRFRDIPPTTAFYTLAVMNAGGVLGRILPALLADAVGRFNLLVPAAFLSGLAALIFWPLAHALVPLMLFAAAYGFASGAFIAGITPCVAQISDIRAIGARIGMLYSIIALPALFGGPIAGALLVHGRGSYMGMSVFSGTTVIAGSLLIICARLKIDARLLARV